MSYSVHYLERGGAYYLFLVCEALFVCEKYSLLNKVGFDKLMDAFTVRKNDDVF